MSTALLAASSRGLCRSLRPRLRPSPCGRRSSAATMPPPATPPGRRGTPAMPGGSARQTGHDLLERPDIAERVRAIRAAWRAVERGRSADPARPTRAGLGRRGGTGLGLAHDPGRQAAGRPVRPRPAQRPPARRPVALAGREARRGGPRTCPGSRQRPARRAASPARPSALWPKRCAGAGTGPSGRSPPTGASRKALERRRDFDEGRLAGDRTAPARHRRGAPAPRSGPGGRSRHDKT